MTVVVAVDGSVASLSAIRLAAYEARCRQTDLVAMTAYRAEMQASAPAARPVGTLRTGDAAWRVHAAGHREPVRPAECGTPRAHRAGRRGRACRVP
jgi:hypothetical protein